MYNVCLVLQRFCYIEKRKLLTTYEDCFQDGYVLTATNMTSQVTCSLSLYMAWSLNANINGKLTVKRLQNIVPYTFH